MIYNKFCYITQVFEGMEGMWDLQRSLGTWGTMQGSASFSKVGEELLYHYQEQGQVYLGGKTHKAYNAYGYKYHHNKLVIHDWNPKKQQLGKLLHTLEFPHYVANCWPLNSYSVYTCQQDVYKLACVFVSPIEFQLNYEVQGPNKLYNLQTTLLRVSGEML